MYARPTPTRFPRNVRVPENYSGNAFQPISSEKNDAPPIAPHHAEKETFRPQKEEMPREDVAENDTKTALETAPPSSGVSLNFGKLLSFGNWSLGTEELLILGLILLVAEGGEHTDLLLLLLLLLFIK